MIVTNRRWGRFVPMQLWYTLTTFLIVLISAIICIIPYSYQSNDEAKNETTSDIFENRLFQDSLLISTVIGLPLMVDVVLDSFALSRGTTNEKIHWGTRLLLLMSLVVPNTFHYFCIQISAQTFAYSTAVVNVTSRGCICIFLSQYHQNIGIGPICISICICYAIVEVLWLIDYMRGDELTVKFSLVFTVITWLQLIYIFFRWQIMWKVSGREKNSDDVCITLYLSSLCILSLGNLVISSAWNDPTQVYPNPIKTSLTMYMQILFVITSMTVSSRVARFNLQKAACTMNERQAFVRYISHELRTPLNAVFLGMTFIKEELKIIPPIQKGYVERIVDTVEEVDNCCQIAISILNDLLTFDKLEEGKMMLDFEETAVVEYIADAVKPFRVEARIKNILISIDILDHESGWENSVALQVDRHKMSQVIRNILSNAIKFTPTDGSVTIKISRVKREQIITMENQKRTLLHSIRSMRNTIVPLTTHVCNHTILSDEGLSDTLRIEVTDNGAGISIDDQKKLFGQYVQFNAGKLQKGNGSGLGLWISKGIVELHGGKHAISNKQLSVHFDV